MSWTRRQMLQLGGAAIAAGSLPSLAESVTPTGIAIRPKVT